MAAILQKLGDRRTAYIFIVALLFLYLAGEADYLLFHTLIELVTITIAACAFIIAWNGQRLHPNTYLLVLGLGFISVATLTLAHTLVYKGMQIIPQADLTFSTQLWIASRGVLALSLLVAPLAIGRRLRRSMVLYCYIILTALLFGAIFVWRIFPVTFIEGRGVTIFKTIAEYVICVILAVGMILLWRRRRAFDRRVLHYLSAGIVFIIAAELAFSTYVDLYGLSNVIGHLLTLIAFAYFYLAIVRTGFSQPLQLLFRDLKESEQTLRESAETWQQTFASVPDLIMVLDREHRILRANRALTQVAGMSESELIGRHCFEVIHAASCPPAFCPHTNLLADGQSHRQEVTEPRLGATWEISVTPLQDAAGKITGSVHVAHDITERKRAEEQMVWLASFPRQNPAPVVEVAADGKAIYTNPVAQKLLPDLGERGLSHPWLAGLEDITRRFREGGETRVLRDVPIGDSWYLQMLMPVLEGRRVRIYATEITQRKQAEEALLRERNRMRLLADTAAQLLAAPDPLDAVNELCREVMEFLDYQMFFVFLADEQADRMHLEAYAGIGEDQAGEMEWLEHGSAFCGCRIPDGEVPVAENIGASADPRLELVRKLGAKAFACHPLRLGDQVLGTLSFGCAIRDTLTEEEVSLIRIVADQVALAVVRKRSEQKLLETERARVQLAETLVSEIGHRTKNNLAIVSGLLQMQMDQEGEKISGPELIRDAVTRILSFASLHEQMYQSQADSIELVDALKRIAEIDRQALSAGDVAISVAGEPVNYTSGVGTTLCVVANELLTNALKHSGRQGSGRRVEAKLALADGQLTISVWNSGEALPENFDIKKRSRTGLGLVHTIVVDQYGGSFTLAAERGGTLARIILSDSRLCGGL
jgi:PAS domain S-box-containing protein